MKCALIVFGNSIVRVFFWAPFCCLLSLSGQDKSPRIELESCKESEGFQLSIKADKEQYRPGEVILLTASLKNCRRTDARVESAGPLFFYNLEVESPVDSASRPARRAPLMAAIN